MQYRFWRTILFAWWMFGRLLFWHFVMARIIGSEAVARGSVARWVKYARQFRRFAITMGGVMIKLGQFISTRVDVLPEEVIQELASLQDEVPSLPFETIRAVLESELGDLETRFAFIDPRPVAAASLGQVHRARLPNGDKVVVKAQRPGIREICAIDLAALEVVARIAMRFGFIRRRADTVELAREFGRVLLEELSYEHEAHNARRFAEMFRDNMGVYIPAVYAEHSTDQVITLEDVTTIKISDYAALEAAGITRKAVAARLMDTYLKQIFEERFFHADPHPGNLFIYPLPLAEGQPIPKEGRAFYLIFIDFGMTGSLTREIAAALVDTLAAIVARDADRLVESYANLGVLLPEADLERVREATVATFDTVWGLDMAQIQQMDYRQIARLGSEFNDLLYAMPFRLPQDFIYLGRTVSILSGMCTSLDPSYNPWHELQPYAQRLVARGFGLPSADGGVLGFPILQELFNGSGPRALLHVGQQLVNRTLVQPARAEAVLERLSRGDLRVQAALEPRIERQLERLEHQQRQTTRAILFGSFLLAGTLFYTSGDVLPALVGFGLSALMALPLLLSGR